MEALYMVLMILAVVCFLITAFGFGSRRVNLLALGLFFWVMVDLLRFLTTKF